MIFITGNEGKVREFAEILGSKLEFQSIDLPEIQALHVEDVVRNKARRAFEIVKKPVLVEDTGIVIDDWNGLPGACTKWFMKSVGSGGIAQMLGKGKGRSAKAMTVVCYFDGVQYIVCEGAVSGDIAQQPIGDNGFGWDDIFVPKGGDKTFAQMTNDEKNKISMRKIAIEKLKELLD